MSAFAKGPKHDRVTLARADKRPFHELPGSRHFDAMHLSSWETAEQHYRRLIQQCHPDRMGQDGQSSAHAEFIEITAAFNKLRVHYRLHGQMPSRKAANEATHHLSSHNYSTAHGRGHAGTTRNAYPPPRKNRWRHWRAPAMAIMLIVTLVTVVVILDKQIEEQNRARAEAGVQAVQVSD